MKRNPTWRADAKREDFNLLVSTLDNFLGEKGFQRVEKSPWEWHRTCGWKCDSVVLWARHGLGGTLNLALEVILPVAGYETNKSVFAMGSVPGRPDRLPNCPRLLRKFFVNSFLEGVTASLETALSWFNYYRTPEQCLNILDSPDSVMEYRCMANIGSEGYQDVKRYLQDVIEQEKVGVTT